MKIFIDTSSLREMGNNFSRTEYVKIEKLCSDYGFSVILHEISKKEFETQTVHKLQEDISKFKSSLSKVTNGVNDNELKNELLQIIACLNEKTNKIEQDKISPFQTWLSKCKHELITIDNTNSTAVFENYFTGGRMFAKVKNRSDIPDSFILEGLIDNIDNSITTVAICSDKRLAEHIIDSIGCELFHSIDDFLNSDIVNNLTFEFSLAKIENKFGEPFLERIIKSEEIKDLIFSAIENYEWSNYQLDSESEEDPTVITFSNVSNLDYRMSNWQDNAIGIRCNFDADVELQYFKFKSDFFAIMSDEEFASTSFEDWNDHYFLVSTTKTLSFEVECEIFFEEGYTLSEGESEEEIIDKIVLGATCEVNPISASFPEGQEI